MRAVLMAGGSGTRLRPLTCDIPKPMVPILNRPISEHIINLLKRHGIAEVIATLYYLPDVMREYFRDGSDFGVSMTYAVEEEKPLGTAGCVKNIEQLLTETFVVISGDSLTDFDLTAALKFHRERGSKATLILTRVPDPREFGVVITDENGRIERFLEKPSSSEVFSDTVNTGTYILEPEVLRYLPGNKEVDFSNDLFPKLLAHKEPMYGYVAEGYWCDVGNLDTYREAQYDGLDRKVQLDFAYNERSPGVWVGEGCSIHPTAVLEAPLIIGKGCRIGAGTKILGGTVLGENVFVGSDAVIQRAIVWNGTAVGDEAVLSACVVARGSRIGRRVQLMEGSVLGPLCSVGDEACVSAGVRVWPSKKIETGAVLNINLIWGSQALRNLFSQRGIIGLANVDITPEFAVKVGAAYGATLKLGVQVQISRDQRPICRMVTRSLISGLMSVGVNVQNLESTAIPIARYCAPIHGVVGGIHVRVHPDRPDYILIEFLDAQGINISKAKEKKIESAYFKEDFQRARIEDIGDVNYPIRMLDYYGEGFQKSMNTEPLRNSKKVVIDYAYGVAGAILPVLLGKFGADAVVLNASLSYSAPSVEQRERLLSQLSNVVQALEASFGVQVYANGEQLVLVDELGEVIRGEYLTAVLAELVLAANPRSKIIIPVNSTSVIEQIANRHDATVIRTKSNPTALMEAAATTPNVSLAGSADMGYIFPQLHPGFDAMFTIAKLIELLTVQERTLAQVRQELPPIHHKHLQVRCSWNAKGSLMRLLVEENKREQVELIDGVKIHESETDWVLVLPDAGDPLVHLYADGDSKQKVDHLCREYRERVNTVSREDRETDEV
ncbi:mannose-1-phosphate guanyltransferase [Candidatus Cyanaurora vandensis]|uniref:mannose-1-phosphate guanyltransferase n=1 Tax=Candidatus Cyanaurora vandensis TaxID=2714958 RepID=UPI00257C13FA|nr:mannose-1-phosphate guanyltransferase [Candidatus Cyanaurora vandensis]